MKKKILMMLALLCAIVQGTRAQNFDVWDGHTTTRPSQTANGGYCINSAAELAYIRDHWDEETGWHGTNKDYHWCDTKYTLTTNIDMGNTSWVPMGEFKDAIFYGEGHTIRINIDGATDNYQGLFAKIGSDATVQNLRIIGNVKCSDSRLVGGIAGQNDGTIKNCWVSADVSSDWKESSSSYTAKVGGIAGENNGTIEYCCMTGNVTNNDADVGGIVGYNSGSGKINHVTFYGTRSSTHSQDNEYVGDQDGTLTNQHGSDLQNNGTLASYIASIADYYVNMYKNAVQYPFSVSCRNVGAGTIVANPEKTRATQTVTLTWTQDMTLEEISVKTVDGNSISVSGNNTDGYSFSMPARDVNVTAVFNTTNWDDEQKGTEDDPFIIDKTNEWNEFVTHVNNGNSYSGKYIKLTADIDVTTMAGVVSGNQQQKPFSGIFDGGGHTITATISDIVDNQGTALFKYINGATIKNLTVAGSVNGGLHAAAIVGFSKGTGNSIENCKATATVNGASHIGGILGHGLDSHIDITKCIFSGKLIGGSVEKGAIYGWGDTGGVATVNNCLYAMQDGQDETKLDVAQTHGGTVTVTDTYKSTTAGSYGWIVDTSEPWFIGLYAPIAGIDGNTYYLRIGSKNDNGNYSTYADMTVKSRIIVKGQITLTLGEGTTLNAKKGIEVSYDNIAYLTINGPGALNIDDCEMYDAGIGAVKVGTLTINGGSITVKGGDYAAGIGCSYESYENGSSGGHIIINGGVVTAYGGSYSSAIGGSYEYNSAGNIEIYGGQVKAFGNGAFGIGPGRAESSGTLKLGWTNPDDFVYINSTTYTNRIASVTFVEGKQFYLEHTATIATATNLYDYKLIPYTGTLPSLAGSGTENNPYLISSTDDWLLFGELINRDTDYSGKFVKLAKDISVTTWVGAREDRPFSGTFDGGRHTLTVNISQTKRGDGVNQQGVAPFHFIKNATIKNLTVDGDITSDTYHTSGLVGFASGTNLIEGCTVKAKLHVGQDYVGGIVGYGLTSTTTIKGCVFAGTIEGTILNIPGSTSRYNVGGIWGWNDSGSTPILINCLEYGTYNSVYSMHPIGLQGNAGTITNCYYLTPKKGNPDNACTVSGAAKAIALDTAPDNLGDLVQDYGIVKAYANGLLYNGKYYVPFALSGSGTEVDPFIVSSTDDWNEFADYVNNGISLSGKFVKLTADINISTMAGASDANSFQGTFDGDGHTLTFTKGTSAEPFAEDYCAPFRHVKNATIKNLHVAGTIYTSAKKAAGFVGESHGALTLTGCISSVNINSSIKGDGTHGGLVSTLSGSGNDITIEGCVFDGSFATTNGTINCGGFIGWPVYNTPTIKNSLMIPASVGAGMLANTFTRVYSTNEPTIDNCYYVATTNLRTDQGTAAVATATAPANLGNLVQNYGIVKAYANGILFDGKYYVAPASISLANAADNSTTISNANGYVANVTLAARTLYKDGAWNTICLPFDVTIADSPLAGAVARPLTSASISGSTLTLTFGDAVTTLKAGTPYIIKWIADANYVDDDEHNIVSPVFSGVTIDKTDRSYDTETASPAVTTDARVRFLGTYSSTTFTAADNSILLLGGENKLYYPAAGAGIGAQRAYFKIGEDGAAAPRLTGFSIDFGDDEATGIISTTNYTNDTNSDAWFTLDGRKLSGKPTAKGLYIVNGKKVIVK